MSDACTEPSFSIYAPLDTKTRQIRVLEILPLATPGAVVDCQLHIVSLDSTTLPFYALSYVWGDPSDDKPSIRVNEHVIEHTRNLVAALYALREIGLPDAVRNDADFPQNVPLRFWIDAICINQDDLAEKSQQVPMMKDIYGRAICVLAWLGMETDGNMAKGLRLIHELTSTWRSEAATSCEEQPPEPRDVINCAVKLDWLRDTSQSMQTTNRDAASSRVRFIDGGWDAISHFRNSPYFTRVWIVQEIALSKSLVFFSARSSLAYRDLVLFHQCVDAIKELPSWPPGVNPDDRFALRTRCDFDAVHATHLWREDKRKGGFPFELWVYFVARCGSSNPRDIIYGFLGMFPLDIVPDYTKSIEEVYADWWDAASKSTTPLQMLPLAGIGIEPNPKQSVPSWLPVWHKIESYRADWKVSLLSLRHPVKETDLYPAIVRNDRVLHCFGLEYGEVEQIESFLFCVNDDSTGQADPVFNYLVGNLCRLRSQTYPTGISWFQAMLLLFCCAKDPMRVGKELTSDTIFGDTRVYGSWLALIRTLTSAHALKDAMERLGCSSEEELWDTLADASISAESRLSAFPHGWDVTKAQDLPDDMRTMILQLIPVVMDHRNRALFHTSEGLLGLGPPGAAQGDAVCIIHGYGAPVLLRKVDEVWKLVGTCYVLSLEEKIKLMHEDEQKLQEFRIF